MAWSPPSWHSRRPPDTDNRTNLRRVTACAAATTTWSLRASVLEGDVSEVHAHEYRGADDHRHRAHLRQSRLRLTVLLRPGVCRNRADRRYRADEYLLQLHPRHGARLATSGAAARRGQTHSLHPRRNCRRRGGRPPRVADLRQPRHGGVERRQPPGAIRAALLSPPLPTR